MYRKITIPYLQMKSFLVIINRSDQKMHQQEMMRYLKDTPFKQDIATNIKYFSNTLIVTDFKNDNITILKDGIQEEDNFIILFDGLGPEEQWKDREIISELFANGGHINNLNFCDSSLLFLDIRKKRVLAYRDQIGIRPLYYYSDSNWLLLSSGIDLIRGTGIANTEIDEEWISDSLVNLSSSVPSTFYKDIKLLEPGHYLSYMEKEMHIVRYYDLYERVLNITGSFTEMSELLKVKLRSSIELYLNDSTCVGAELSGGLDSSALVALGNRYLRHNKAKFHTFSSVLSDSDKIKYYPYSDESEYSDSLIRELEINSHHRLLGLNRGVLSEFRSHLKLMGGPTQQLFTLFSDEIYEKANSLGVDTLLSGFGGDEGVSYGGAGVFDELAHSGKWNLYLKEMRATKRLHGNPAAKGYLKYLTERYMPFGKDLLSNHRRSTHWKKMKIKGFAYDKDFGNRMNIKSRYLLNKGFATNPDVLARQYYRLKHPQVSQRLTYAYQIGIKYNFTYAFPLLNRKMVEFHLSLPTEYKYHNGYGRAIFREAMKGLVPDSIRMRTDKRGTTIPSVQKRMLKDYDPIRELILISKSENKYHYIDYDKMLVWQELLRNRSRRTDIPYNPAGFYNSLQILLLQEMERTGDFKTGIFC